ncbi:MAG TPA: DHA2 family efflux MFS transporter permease subunit, partial [Candidatus Binataceae bacterium]
ISAWMSGLIGRKRFYMSCVALFTVSSFLCGVAPSLSALIICRVMQGAGGGGLQPSEQAILADTFAPEKFGMAFAMYGMAVVLAPAIGPTLGGYITDHFNWRWIFFINVPIGALSLLLTYRMVEDPAYLKNQKGAGRRWAAIDYIGLGLIALGLGCLQIVLDKGQEDDWLRSHFIATLAAIFALSLIAFVLWERRQKNPVVDLKLFQDRTFATAVLMMFVVGISLYGSTVLLPLFLQQLMGYTAQLSGMVLSPGGLAIMLMMPLVGILISQVQARGLIAVGFGITALALFQTANINLAIDFKTVLLYRVYQSIGLAFLFVPINTIAYIGMPREKNNQISSIINLARNIGASVGVSIVTTMVARRSQVHQDTLAIHVTHYHRAVGKAVHGLSAILSHKGLSSTGAVQQAYGRIYGQVQMQAATQAYVDTIWLLGALSLLMLPLVFLLKKNDPRQARAIAH